MTHIPTSCCLPATHSASCLLLSAYCLPATACYCLPACHSACLLCLLLLLLHVCCPLLLRPLPLLPDCCLPLLLLQNMVMAVATGHLPLSCLVCGSSEDVAPPLQPPRLFFEPLEGLLANMTLPGGGEGEGEAGRVKRYQLVQLHEVLGGQQQ